MKSQPIKPDPEDYAAVECEYGPLPPKASRAQHLYRHQLAQANKIIRLYESKAPRA
jgi:hypothetical protein